MRRASFFSAYYILFVDFFSFALVFPLFPLLMLDPGYGLMPAVTSEGGRNLALGLLLAAFPLAQFAGAPLFGYLSDTYGRKKTLYWSLGATLVCYAITGLSIYAHSYSLLLVSRIAAGFFAGTLAISMAIIADLTPLKKERGRHMSLVAALMGTSWIFAVVFGVIYYMPQRQLTFSLTIPFWFLSSLTLTSLFVLWKGYEESAPLAQKLSKKFNLARAYESCFHLLSHKPLEILNLTLFFWYLGFFLSLQWAAPVAFAKFEITFTKMIWFYLFTGVAWSFSSGLINLWLIEHASLWKITTWSLFATALFFFFAGASDFFLYFDISYAACAVFGALAFSNTLALISISAPEESQGRAFGVAQSIRSLGQFASPIVGGLIAAASIEPLFFTASLLVFISFLILLTYILKRTRRASELL